MWKENIGDASLNIKREGLLPMALKKYTEAEAEGFPKFGLVKALRDSYGLIAYEGAQYVLVAKSYPYGDIVSINRKLFERVLQLQKKLVMYIGSSDKFYEFDLTQLSDTKINRRGSIEMVNFSIRDGANLLKVVAPPPPQAEQSKMF